MKRTMRRNTIVLILAFAFLAGLVFLCFRYYTQGDSWASQTYNQYLSSGKGLAAAGKVYDRNGVVLAQSVDGGRIYSDDLSTRRALLHTVGDSSYNILTAVQSRYRASLVGYNTVFGYGMPESLKSTRDIHLTVDAVACAKVYDAFNGMNGACFVYNYKTGQTLCMVSTPGYDPNSEPDPDKAEDGVYLNNCISSTFTPGSIFKIVTAAAAFDYIDDIDTRTYTCNSKEEIGGSEVTCLESHGDITMKEAFAHSCNIVFAKIACEIGAERMQRTADALGIGSSYNFGGVSTAKGHYDVRKADENALAWSGIGQSTDLVNPAQMAILCGAIGSGGKTVLPYYVEGVTSGSTNQLMKASTADRLAEYMRYTISDYYGDSMFDGLTVCAKTGTAEVGEGEPNAWIVGYSTDEDCPLAFAVVVEHGGYGFYTAGPIAVTAMTSAAQALRGDNQK